MGVRITFYNLSVRLETKDMILLSHINSFLERFYTVKDKGFSKATEGKDKGFFGKVTNRGVFQLHNNQFVHLYHHLKDINYPLTIDEKIDKKNYKITEADMVIRDGWSLREEQIPIAEFLLNDPTKAKLIPITMGSGKTFVSLYTVAKIRNRVAVVILADYVDKWISDIAGIHEVKTDDIMVVRGSKALRAVIEMAKTDSLDNDHFIFSNRTLSNFIKEYEEDPELCVDMYGASPMDLFPLLGIGTLLIDETHQHFHSMFKIVIYSNVKFQIGLSATLMSDDPVITRAHKVMYPGDAVYGDKMIKKYIDLYPVAYGMMEHRRKMIKISNFGSTHYSHTAYEQSILKKSELIDIYYRIINAGIQDYYIPEYQVKDKLLIFVATIQMATQVTAYLKEKYPDKLVNRYCDGDDYEDLMSGDIIVSTPLSAGTAVDVPNLRVVIQTVCISSPVSNLQNLGRLRKLKDRDVKFVYLYCENIGKHKDYHMRRVELFKDHVSNIAYRRSRVSFLTQARVSRLLRVEEESKLLYDMNDLKLAA